MILLFFFPLLCFATRSPAPSLCPGVTCPHRISSQTPPEDEVFGRHKNETREPSLPQPCQGSERSQDESQIQHSPKLPLLFFYYFCRQRPKSPAVLAKQRVEMAALEPPCPRVELGTSCQQLSIAYTPHPSAFRGVTSVPNLAPPAPRGDANPGEHPTPQGEPTSLRWDVILQDGGLTKGLAAPSPEGGKAALVPVPPASLQPHHFSVIPKHRGDS